jgi:probable rRNA maturation factor
MNYHIDIQNASKSSLPLTEEEMSNLAMLALRDQIKSAELTIRLVDAEEMIHLNSTYRKQNKTTNVLAFPSNVPDHIELDFPLLGDIIICPEVLAEESREQGKTIEEHWALILIHGVLHLLGYDHIKDEEAQAMQALEIKLLAERGYTNPYETKGNELE